jgi:hypothetical protein
MNINGKCFPSDDWTDFPFIVLRAWCENILENVIKKNSSEFILNFMDGPFYIECINKNGNINMKFINDRNKKFIEYEYTINKNNLIENIYNASKELIILIDENEFEYVQDSKELEKVIRLLHGFT